MKTWIFMLLASVDIFCVAIRNKRNESTLESRATIFSELGPSKVTPGVNFGENLIAVEHSYREPQCSPKSRASPSVVLHNDLVAVSMIDNSESVARRVVRLWNCIIVQLVSVRKPDLGLQPPLSAFLLSVGGGYADDKAGLANLNYLRRHSGKTDLFVQIEAQTDATHTTYVGEVHTHLLRPALSAFMAPFLNDTKPMQLPQQDPDNRRWFRSLVDVLRGRQQSKAGPTDDLPQPSAVLISGYDLDYLQRLAETYFGRMHPPTTKTDSGDNSTKTSKSVLTPKNRSDVPIKACVVPANSDPTELRISWPLYFNDTTAAMYANALSPYAYIPLQDKSEGSLSSVLLSSDSITSMRYELEVDDKMAIPSVVMTLPSSKGKYSDVDHVVTKVFAYLERLRSEGVPLHYINEVHAKKYFASQEYNSMDWKTMVSMGLSGPQNLAETLAKPIRILPLELWSFGTGGWGELTANITTTEDLSLSALKQRFYTNVSLKAGSGLMTSRDAAPGPEVGQPTIELIQVAVNTLTVNNAIITESSPRCKALVNTVDPNFGTQFSIEEVPNEVLARWRDAKATKMMSLPRSNPWFPLQSDSTSSLEMNQDDVNGWKIHLGSVQPGDVPVGSVSVEFASDEYSDETALNRFKFNVLTSLMHEVCSSGAFYAARQAGYSCEHTEFTPKSIRFSCTGHSTNLTDYALMLLDGVHSLPDLPEHRYLFHTDKIKNKALFYGNLSEAQQAVRYLDVALDDSIVTADVYTSFASLVTPYRLKMLATNLSVLLRERVIPGTSWFQRLKGVFWSRKFLPVASIDVRARSPEAKTEAFVHTVTKKLFPFEGKSDAHPSKQNLYFAIPHKKLVILRLQSAKKGLAVSAICLKFQIEDSLYGKREQVMAMLSVLVDALKFEFDLYFTEGGLEYDVAEVTHDLGGDPQRMQPATVNFVLQSCVSNPLKLRNLLQAFLDYFEGTVLPKIGAAETLRRELHQNEDLPSPYSVGDLQNLWRECFSVAGVRRRAAVSEVWPEGDSEVGMTGSLSHSDDVSIYPSPVLLKNELRASNSMFLSSKT